MKCPECQFDNSEEAKFCTECGVPMEFHCPKCGAKTRATGKFCMECGHNLSTLTQQPRQGPTSEEILDKIKPHLPDGLPEEILAQRGKIEGERKQVTVIFCDMEGYTAIAEKLGPEEAYSLMDDVYELLIHNVYDYGGTVNELTGDGIMALFGAPIAQEDAPQRAIRSALAIHREMVKFSDRMKVERRTPPLNMRVGIHTGPVVVGTVGNDLRVEFKAVGDTVNMASRMEEIAEPGTTFVTDDTFKLTEGLFRFEAMGERAVKGKEEPIRTYRVIAPSTRRTRFDVNAERGLTSFVGREKELELLLDGYQRAREGRGQAFSIVAEAGVGKSRLLYEFRKIVANEDAYILEGRCLSFSQGVAYHPVIDILKSNFDIRDFDGDLGIKDKVTKGLNTIKADEATTLPYLLELLGVEDSGIDAISMSPEGRKERILEALKRIVLKGSEMRPLIMAIEDLHWSDKSSEEALKDILESISGARVLLVFTYRPEFVHTWGGKSYHSQINLNRLSNRESLSMVTNLLGAKDVDTNLEELVLEKTEGIPFFIEELIKSLKELKIIERVDGRYSMTKDSVEVAIPGTIQDVIMARVDSLPDGAKRVLQTGSVIEREFSYDLIQKVTGLQESDLLSHLSALKDSELAYERGIFPQSTYIFKHALTREVVYDSILDRRKKELHREIADAIEQIYKDNLEEHYTVLSKHYDISENYAKGAEFSRLAGKAAEKKAFFGDAIAYFEKGVDCLEKLPRTEDIQKQIIDARTTLGLYMIQMFHYIPAMEVVAPIVELTLSSGYKKRIAQIHAIIGSYNLFLKEDYAEALYNLGEALKISEDINDVVSSFFACSWLGFAHSFWCEFEKAAYYFEKGLAINVAANNLWGMVASKSVLNRNVHLAQGKVHLGFLGTNEALSIAEESGDIYSKAIAYSHHGSSCFFKGLFMEAERYLLEGIVFANKINFLFLLNDAHLMLGNTYFEKGEYQKAKDHYQKAVCALEAEEALPSLINAIKTSIALIEAMNNERDIDLELLFDYATENKLKVHDSWIRRNIANILMNIDDQHISETEEWINKAIEADRGNGTMWDLGMDYTLYAELFKRNGDKLKAEEYLLKAIDVFKECGSAGWVEKTEKELDALL